MMGNATQPDVNELFAAAFALEQQGHISEARRLYEEIVSGQPAISPVFVNATFRLGLLLEQAGMLPQALELYEKSAEQDEQPTFRALGAYHAASVLERLGEYQRAIDWCARGAAERFEGVPTPLGFELKRLTCLARLQRLQEIQAPEPRVELDGLEQVGWMEAAIAIDRAGDLQTARVFYERLLQAGNISEQLRADAVIRIRLLPNKAQGLLGAARSTLAAGEFGEVVNMLDAGHAPPLFPGHALATSSLYLWFTRITAAASLKQVRVDEEDLALGLPQPGEPVEDGLAAFWMEAAFALERFGYARAAKHFYEALLRVPNLSGFQLTNLHYRLGIVLDTLLQWDEAMECYKLAVDSPHSFPAAQADARLRLAETYYAMGDYGCAGEHFCIARKIPELSAGARAHAQLRYGMCLLRSKDIPSAIEELARCSLPGEGRGTEVEVKADSLLAEIYENRGDWPRARQYFQRVIDHACADPLTKAGALNKLATRRK